MKLLAVIRPKDVDPHAPDDDYATFVARTAGRAIIFDGDKVALIHVSKQDYYMLPGGGIEDEAIPVALVREIMEEVGCKIKIGREVGRIKVYFDRWHQKQMDFCYTAHKVGSLQTPSLIEFEKAEGFKTVWAKSLSEAIALVQDATPKEHDGKLVRARDLLFLKTLAANI